MEFRQSAPDELSPPPPPPPPSMWLKRSVSDQPPPPPKPLTEMELRRSSPNQPSYGDLNDQLATRGNKFFYEGILLEEKEAITESKGVDMSSLEPKVREATEHKEENNIQDGTAATSVKAEVPWSAWRATLSQTGRVLKTFKGVLNILTPEKVDILKDQPIASEITSADILKKDESIPIPPTGNIITRSTLRGDGSVLQSAGSVAKSPSVKHRCGLGDDYLNQGIGYNVEYIGQGIGRENENYEMLNKVHPKIERGSEEESRNRFGIGCNVEYFGQGTGKANGDVDMFNDVDPDIQRAFEKQKIREEITAAEMARRRELEAEVREELRIERELALRNKKGGNEFDSVRVPVEPWEKSLVQEVEGLSLEDNVAMSVEEKLRIQGRTETSGMDMFPFQQMSLESKVNETVQEKEKNIFLAKSSADSVTQEEALVPETKSGYTVFGVWGVGNIEGKKVWRCFLCRVSATSETTLKQHFNGNKHRSKRAALQAKKSAAITGEAEQISQIEPLMPTSPPIATAKPLDGHGISVLLPENKNKAKCKERFAFWCEMCNVGANNKYVMEAHKKGKKHLSQLKKKFPFWCDLCNVGADRAHTMNAHTLKAHLRGKRHLTMLQEKAASTTAEQGNSPLKIV